MTITYESLTEIPLFSSDVKFYLLDDMRADGVDTLSAEMLSYVVRESEQFAFEDGETIAEAGSHSDAELWSDVVLPAIVAGVILVSVKGVLL